MILYGPIQDYELSEAWLTAAGCQAEARSGFLWQAGFGLAIPPECRLYRAVPTATACTTITGPTSPGYIDCFPVM